MPKKDKKSDKVEEQIKEETSGSTNPWEQPISSQPGSIQQKEGDEVNDTLKPAAKPAPPPRVLNINTSDTIVKISIGDPVTAWVNIHKGLLLQHSDYFIEWFKPDLNSTKKYSYHPYTKGSDVRFVTHSIDAVKIYSQYLYTGVIQTSPPSTQEPTCALPPWVLLVRAYIFEVRAVDPIFCNAVMDTFIDLHTRTGKLNFPGCVKIAFKKAVAGSPLRSFFADMYAYNLADDPGLNDVLKEFPKDFLVDVIASKVRNNTDEDWWVHLKQKKYHQIIEEETKDKEGKK